MPILLVWDNDQKSILRQVYVGHWTQEDFFASFAEAEALYSSVEHDIDLIIDLRQNQTNPLSMINTFSRTESRVHPNHASVTVVGVNSFIRVLGGISVKLAPRLSRNLAFVATLDEAYAHIRQMRARRLASRV